MRNNDYTPLFILALNTNSVESDRAILSQAGFNPIDVEGVYKGQSEASYIVQGDKADVLAVARDHNQESVLYLDNQRAAWLVYCEDGREEFLGEFKQVSQTAAKNAGAYTKTNEGYFIAA